MLETSPLLLSKPQTSCQTACPPGAPPASCARAGPPRVCIRVGFFQYSWFVRNCVKLLPSVTCSVPPGKARLRGGAGPSFPTSPGLGSWGLLHGRQVSQQKWEREHGWGFGPQGWTSVLPTFPVASHLPHPSLS
ncbi:hypothetical protein mRhiFer1_010227 [Rhinolophus ferrumequinum]|uniref:Uncharacterized protein n=1 Tax=Rhinolophus ferrumequinum TaxID=59479 RepID=A0A7J7X585_RHIFE|nr:hypothetical protein mRhiFer1_010227 [Rhinolophus ferrumequinum]